MAGFFPVGERDPFAGHNLKSGLCSTTPFLLLLHMLNSPSAAVIPFSKRMIACALVPDRSASVFSVQPFSRLAERRSSISM